MATTPNGLPYPVGTDPVSAGDDAIRDLALAVDPYTRKAATAPITGVTGWGTSTTTAGRYGIIGWAEGSLIASSAVGITTSFLTVANLADASFRPRVNCYATGQVNSGQLVQVAILTTGAVQVRSMGAGFSWPASGQFLLSQLGVWPL